MTAGRRAVLGTVALVALLGMSACAPRQAERDVADGRSVVDVELYGAGLFTTGAWDFFMAWSPDQRDVLFCRANDDFSAYEILETRVGADGHWSPPVRPKFAAAWSDADPHVSPDGRRVLFISNRPLPSDTGATRTIGRQVYDIWVAERQSDFSWGEATRLDAPVNDSRSTKWSPSVAANGNLYVGTARPGGRGGNDIWLSRLADGRYLPPENLGDSINTAGAEIEPWIAPDESYLIFSGAARSDSLGGYDLYLSRRMKGVWQKAQLLAPPVNSSAFEFNQACRRTGGISTSAARGRIRDQWASDSTGPATTRRSSGLATAGAAISIASRSSAWDCGRRRARDGCRGSPRCRESDATEANRCRPGSRLLAPASRDGVPDLALTRGGVQMRYRAGRSGSAGASTGAARLL